MSTSREITNKGPVAKMHTWEWYKNFTTIGGFSHIFASENARTKPMWIVLTIAGLAMTILSIALSFKELLAFDVVTSVTVTANDSLEFPTVTICNANRVHCGQLVEKVSSCANETSVCDLTTKHQFCRLLAVTGCFSSVKIFNKFRSGNNSSPMLDEAKLLCQKSLEEDNELRTVMQTTEGAKRENEIANLYYRDFLQLPWNHTKLLAHQPDRMVKSCMFGNDIQNTDCTKLMSQSEATRVLTPRYGVCYAFNYVGREKHSSQFRLTTISTGPDFGLTLTLQFDHMHYMRYGLSPSQSIDIILSQPTSMPQLLSSHIQIGPNTETSIALSLTQIKRQSDPYPAKCTDDYPAIGIFETFENLIPKDTIYSEGYCKSLCMMLFVYENCACMDPLLIETKLYGDPLPGPFCPISKAALMRKCADDAMMEYKLNASNYCPCKPQCNVVSYEATISEAQWPSATYWAMIAEENQLKFNGILVKDDDVTDFLGDASDSDVYDIGKIKEAAQEGFAKVNIFFKTMNVHQITETPQYNAFTFLSSLGGGMSLWLGVCFISIFELLEFIIRLIGSLFTKRTANF